MDYSHKMEQKRDRYNLRWRGRFAFFTGFMAVILLISFLGVWGTQTRIAGAVIASGLVKVENNRQVIQHADGGIVSGIYAHDGDFVEAGAILITLDDTDVRSELIITEQRLIETIARIARLKAERDGAQVFEIGPINTIHTDVEAIVAGQVALFNARSKSYTNELALLNEQIIQFREQIKGVDAQIQALDLQMTLLDEQIHPLQKLVALKMSTRPRLLEKQSQRARLQGEKGQVIALRSQHLSSIAGSELGKIRLQTSYREKIIDLLRELESDQAEFQEKANIASRKLERMSITAPVSGIIYGSQVFTLQSVIQKAKDIMHIVPQDQNLVVSVRVPAVDVDQIRVGQEVSLRFTALDQRFTPEIFGILNTISADIFVDKTTGKAYYEAEISPLSTEVSKLGNQTLVPGMPVDAYIKTTVRSPLNYLIKPLADYFKRAFRES